MDTNLKNDIKNDTNLSEIENISSEMINENQEENTNSIDGYKEELQRENNIDEEEKTIYIKEKNRFMSSVFGTILIIFLLTIISVGSYAPIKDILVPKKDSVKEYIESREFSYRLGDLTNYLRNKNSTESSWHDSRYDSIESIKYYITQNNTNLNESNMSNISEEAIQKQINDSKFYLEIKTDENGNFTVIEDSPNINFDKQGCIGNIVKADENKLQYANLDIVYVVPQNLNNYNDFFTQNVKESSIFPYGMVILAIGAVFIIILSIIAFSIPYSIQKTIPMCSVYSRMFIEFKVLIWIIFIFAFTGLMTVMTDRYNGNNAFNIIDTIYDANSWFYTIGIPTTFILYLLIYLSIVYVKYAYYEGVKEGLIRNSIFGRMILYMNKNLKVTLKQIFEIDTSKDYNRKLLMMLLINLLVLWVIALTGGFGFILSAVYTVLLFKYLLKLIEKVKYLNDASSDLAQGNFNISLDENIGILTPIAKNLNNIKDGFKLAVDKEVKSQHMKTELISNVSHDLKTPLTSIITYVDLLKNKDVSADTQKEYIEILDKKSKRLKVLIEDLFEASKASSGNIELNLETIDIIALFRQTLGELEEKINKSTLDIKMNFPENKVMCKLDGRRTYRIFENIMINILKYSMPNSRVYIDIAEDEKEVSFVFKNISSYEMNFDATQITERFTRGDKSRNTEGSGLGLAIAKSLINLQNGNLEISIDGDLFKLIATFPKEQLI